MRFPAGAAKIKDAHVNDPKGSRSRKSRTGHMPAFGQVCQEAPHSRIHPPSPNLAKSSEELFTVGLYEGRAGQRFSEDIVNYGSMRGELALSARGKLPFYSAVKARGARGEKVLPIFRKFMACKG